MKPIETKFIVRNQHALRSTRATYHLLVHAGTEGFVANSNMTSIEVDGGNVWINGIPVNAPKFTPDHISWRQHTAHGYSAGCVYLYEDGISVHGAISHGANARTASQFDVVGTAIKPIAYRTRISKSPQPLGTDPGKIPAAEFVDGLPLEIGYETQIGGFRPSPTVSLGGQDITPKTTWLVDQKGRTVLSSPWTIRSAPLRLSSFAPLRLDSIRTISRHAAQESCRRPAKRPLQPERRWCGPPSPSLKPPVLSYQSALLPPCSWLPPMTRFA